MNAGAQLPKLLRFWGIDRAILYTVIARGWSVVAGPVTLVFLAIFLTPAEQGFYYTFASVLGLQIFFELGLTIVILQFASYEKASLEWTEHGTLEGDANAKARLASLLRRALAWYGVVAVLVLVTVLPTGLIFFGQHQPSGVQIIWQLPWLWVVLASSCSLFVSPIYAMLEGCGLVAEVASVRLGQAIAGNILFWSVLTLGGGLFAAPALSTAGLLWGAGWLAVRKKAFLADLVPFRWESTAISWRREVWPFQWRIALSWLSGYFSFQLFNPALLAFHGAVAAGQMGMSSTVMAALWTMAFAWVNTKAAPFGSLIARRDFEQLDRMFFAALWQSFSVVSLGGAAFWVAGYSLHRLQHPLSQRLLEPIPLGLLIVASILQYVVSAEAVYLRAHKQEPFLGLSLLNGCLIGLSTYFLGRQFGATGMMAGYCAITLVVGVGGGSWIFARKRRLWHQGGAECN